MDREVIMADENKNALPFGLCAKYVLQSWNGTGWDTLD